MLRRFAIAFVLLLAFAASAHAGDVAQARRLFAEGVRLYQAGDWEAARRLFREADAEHHAAAIVYNIGLAEEKLGNAHAAVEQYESYLREAGDKGDLATSASAAITQIKARTTQLTIETHPPGARLVIDGVALSSPAPATRLLPAGPHVVSAQGDGWTEQREVVVRGVGDTSSVVIDAPVRAAPVDPPSSSTSPPPVAGVEPSPPAALPAPGVRGRGPEGLVWGAAFAMAPAYLIGVSTAGASNAQGGLSIAAGPLLEIGYALTDRFEFLARGFAGLGPDGKPSYAYMIGPGLSYRAGPVWVGPTFLVGQFETRAHGARYGTDIVFGAMVEANVVVIEKPEGQWLAGINPAVLLTEMHRDNTAIFFPLTFGYRGF